MRRNRGTSRRAPGPWPIPRRPAPTTRLARERERHPGGGGGGGVKKPVVNKMVFTANHSPRLAAHTRLCILAADRDGNGRQSIALIPQHDARSRRLPQSSRK